MERERKVMAMASDWWDEREEQFDEHVREMEEWLQETGLDCDPIVSTRFEEFKNNRNVSAAVYYDMGNALADHEDYLDQMGGF